MYIVKLIFSLSFFLLLSCSNSDTRSFDSLSEAFDSWYLMHNPEMSSNLDPYNYYLKNKKGDLDYLNEYMLDLKRFKLELGQIDKDKLNVNNLYKYNMIDNRIAMMIFNSENFKDYNYDPSYYINITNNHLLSLLIDKNTSFINRSESIIELLDLLPTFLKRLKQNIISSNRIFIQRGIENLHKTIALIDAIPIYLELNDNMLEEIEFRINKNKKILKNYINWLNNNLNNNFEFNDENFLLAYKRANVFLEEKYSYDNLLNSLELTIINLQNNIFQSSLPIYLEYNDEPIWPDRDDTLNVIKFVINPFLL